MQLEWSRHPIELADGISRLLESRQLLDVTLSAEGKQIKAHRIVLAAASEYFKSMLTDDDMDRLPIVYFRETPFTQLESLLQFIYSGRTQVTTSDLNSFMQLAYGLGIKGFADKQVTNQTVSESVTSATRPPSSQPRTPTKRKVDESNKENLYANLPPPKDESCLPPPMRHTSEPTNLFPSWATEQDMKKRRKKFHARSLDEMSSPKKGDNWTDATVAAARESSPSGKSYESSSSLSSSGMPFWTNTPLTFTTSAQQDDDVFKKPLPPRNVIKSETNKNSAPSAAHETKLLSPEEVLSGHAEGTGETPHLQPVVDAPLSSSTSFPSHPSSRSCPAGHLTARRSLIPEEQQQSATYPGVSNKSAEDAFLPPLDPNELAAKGATLLRHLALWMMEEKRLHQEHKTEKKLTEHSLPGLSAAPSAPGTGGSHTFPRPRNASGTTPQRRGGSECDRPDSGFDSKDEEAGREGPTPPPAISEEGSASSPEDPGEIRRQAPIRQPVLRKRRMNLH